MLSPAFIRENIDAVRKAIADKNVSLDLDQLLLLDGEVKGLKTRIDEQEQLVEVERDILVGDRLADGVDILANEGRAQHGPRLAGAMKKTKGLPHPSSRLFVMLNLAQHPASRLPGRRPAEP